MATPAARYTGLRSQPGGKEQRNTGVCHRAEYFCGRGFGGREALSAAILAGFTRDPKRAAYRHGSSPQNFSLAAGPRGQGNPRGWLPPDRP